MKKVIKAQLYIPKMEEEEFNKKFRTLCEQTDKWIKDIYFEAGLGEYDDKEVSLFECVITNMSASSVNEDYKNFKELIKEIFGKQPKQIIMMKLDRI